LEQCREVAVTRGGDGPRATRAMALGVAQMTPFIPLLFSYGPIANFDDPPYSVCYGLAQSGLDGPSSIACLVTSCRPARHAWTPACPTCSSPRVSKVKVGHDKMLSRKRFVYFHSCPSKLFYSILFFLFLVSYSVFVLFFEDED
jgi:hypothetical protein